MKHKRFEENILVDEAYTNYGNIDKNADQKKGQGIAKHFAETLEYEEKKKWYHQVPQEPTLSCKNINPEQIEAIKKEAINALHGDTLAYETKLNKSGSSDHQWAKTLLNKGSIADRVAAATILIQDNPLYNLNTLRNLINNVKPAKKKDGIVVIDTLSELLISDLLIPNAKLRTFEQHPLGHLDDMTSGNKQLRRNILKIWYYEDQLKELYGTYVESLNKFAHDSVVSNKEKAVCAMSYLLMHNPEREKMLLINIINKLGDPSQAVASKVIYQLCQLLYNHPNMKSVVLTEIEKMLFRTNISPRAQYYGICFLNQFYLDKDDAPIAENLIRIYFSFFKASIKKAEIDSRVMSAILTGVKRAYPFADKARLADTPAHIDAIHKLVYVSTENIAIHSLALLYYISDASKGCSDRYYNALYRKLTNPKLFNSTHSPLLFSLVYKSLKSDKDVQRVTSFIKRLLQLCCYMTAAQACGMLFLVSQVLKDGDKKDAVKLVWTKTDVKEEIKEENKNEAPNEAQDIVVEINDTLDTGTEKNDNNSKEKKIDLLKGDKKDLLIDDDEDYVDLKIDDEGNIKPKKRKKFSGSTSGWFHMKIKSETVEDDKDDIKVDKDQIAKIQFKKTINTDKVVNEYTPLARNPSYAGAHCTAYLELLPLSRHYHPTVKLFAQKLVNEQIIQYSGDPLKDFSGIRFLDRFVFKNPKKREDLPTEDGELKKVKGSHPKFAVRKNYSAKGIRSIPVNSSTYLNEDASKIPVDEKFLYDFLQKRRETGDSDEDSDADSVNSDDFEKYLDSVTGTKTQDDSDEELDYLADMEANKNQLGNKNKEDGDPELATDDEEDDYGDQVESDDGDNEGGLDISGDEDEPALSGDDDELMLEQSDEDDQINVPGEKLPKNKMKLKLKGKDDLGSLFASAEEFSSLLEETATNKKQGSSQAVSNTDNSSTKQLAWEDKRDRWIKGYNKKILGNKKSGRRDKKRNGSTVTNNKGSKRKSEGKSGGGGKKRKFK